MSASDSSGGKLAEFAARLQPGPISYQWSTETR